MKTRVFIVLLFFIACTATFASDDETILGGLLYDKWWTMTGKTEPNETHPAYPAAGKKTGKDTWRCKECHGWDYMGKDGAYSKGSHFTGIKGIRAWAGKSDDEIEKILRGKDHAFTGILREDDFEALAKFVANGQIDADQWIDRNTKMAKGDAKNGKKLFGKQCERCHGKKGETLNISGTTDKTQYLADISTDNPWETLHKIRFGHPGATIRMRHMNGREGMGSVHKDMVHMGEGMPPMFSRLSVEEQVDLLRYIQEFK